MPVNSIALPLLAALAMNSAEAQELGIVPLKPRDVVAASPVEPIAVPAATTSNPAAAPLPIEQTWTLQAGKTMGQNLKAWAATASWTVVWQLPKDWVVPAPAAFTGGFSEAAAAAIETLASNGALIRAQIYEGNRTIVISGPGVAQQ
jgi:hypothetical protein